MQGAQKNNCIFYCFSKEAEGPSFLVGPTAELLPFGLSEQNMAPSPPHAFHRRCGGRVTLTQNNTTAIRNPADFNCGLVLSAESLTLDQLFEVRIDRKISSWSGSIEMGVTACDPATLDLPSSATDLRDGSWIMSGNSILRDGRSVVEVYGRDLDQLGEGDTVGVMRTSQGELMFYVNGQSQGVAAVGLPLRLYAVVDMYGKCAQVSIIQPEQSSTITDRQLVVPTPDPRLVTLLANRLRFHPRCGNLVKLSNGGRTAERRRPLDEFNNGVVMTNRQLRDNELFEIRIDKLVAKWSGSIEAGVTSHNPEELAFPATMTNLRSGTTMMSGCGILTNGQGTRREYGHFNLDELRQGDRIGMVRRTNNDLHYLINGMDQGVAAQNITGPVWGVIDLYGMTVKVTIVDRDEREEQNLMTRRNTSIVDQQLANDVPDEDQVDRLTFHRNCGTHAAVINNGRTAHRPNAMDDFNNGVVLTGRLLRRDELFEVRLDKMVTKWAGSIEIGVTTHCPTELEYPSTMTNVRSGTWMMTGNGVMHNGTTIIDEYGQNLDRLTVGDRVGVMRRADGTLHFFVNGTDQGAAASGVPERVYGVIDLYGQAAQASMVDSHELGSASLMSSMQSNTCMYTDLRFHHAHGKNARISNNGLTASRPRAFGEFNDAIVMSNRPLREGELFEVLVERTVDRWSGSIEAGVTSIRPDELDFPSTMTDIDHDTWMLSGSSVMQDGATTRNGYKCDLDAVRVGSRIGMMRHADGTLHFYMNGEDQGIACEGIPPNVYAVIDLYGQCAQVSIMQPPAPGQEASVASSHPLASSPLSLQLVPSELTHRFSPICGKNIVLKNNNTMAVRSKHFNHGLVLSSEPLQPDQVFEVSISAEAGQWAGSLRVGVTSLHFTGPVLPTHLPASITDMLYDTWFIAGSQVRHNKTIHKLHFCPSLDWLLPGDRVGLLLSTDNSLRLMVNSEDMGVAVTALPKSVFAVVDIFGRTEAITINSGCRVLPGIGGAAPQSTTLAANSPGQASLRSSRLQDSLELLGVRSPLSPVPNSAPSAPPPPPPPPPPLPPPLQNTQQLQPAPLQVQTPVVAFHERHGRNIQLSNSRTTAHRTGSYNQGLVVGSQPLPADFLFQVKVDRVSSRWTSTLLCGVTAQLPDNMTFPVTALGLKKNTWVICSDGVFHNGVKQTSTMYGPDWEQIGVCRLVGLMVDTLSQLHLFVDGEDQGIAAVGIPQPCYPIIDVYGQCEQVTLVGPDTVAACGSEKEKAELEGDEKEGVSPSCSLVDLTLAVQRPLTLMQPLTVGNSQCEYQQVCLRFKASLGLPDGFFTGVDTESSVCYCEACDCNSMLIEGSTEELNIALDGEILSHGEPPNEYWLPLGWCSFALRRPPKPPDGPISCSSWHVAFHPSSLSALRRSLDNAALLMPGEFGVGRSDGRLPKGPVEDSDGATLILAPCIQYAVEGVTQHEFVDPKTNKQWNACVALQALVQPGSYSVHGTADQHSQKWATKERGNTVLSALLVKLDPA